MIEKGLFEWDATREEAALLLARGELTNQKIADKLDIGVATLYRWKDYQEFKERIEELVARFREEALKLEIGDLGKRLGRYNKRWQQIDELIKARGKDPKNGKVAGGKTGLMARDFKGENEVWKFDGALLKEERELAKQAAIELGQWTEKADLTSDGKPFAPAIFQLPDNRRDPGTNDYPTAGGPTDGVPGELG